MATSRLCSIPDCGKAAVKRGMCDLHYRRALRNDPMRERCSVAGCDKPQKSHGLCSAHVARFRKYGDPLGNAPPKYSSDICSVEGCDKPRHHAGLCHSHYKRQWRHGDPLAGRSYKAPAGEPLAWLFSHIDHEGGECLIWPFARDPSGYGAFGTPKQLAHREMCRLVHGEPPTPEHQVAHSCGKGHEGCVHPGHLRWATNVENSADRFLHGTMLLGENANSAKLTESEVRQIRALRGKQTQVALAKMFGIHQATVSAIHRRKTWSWLT